MKLRFGICAAAFVLGVALAGLPLSPLGIVEALAVCAIAALASGRFIAGTALLATLASGWLQHHQFRITVMIASAFVGIVARYLELRLKPR